MTTNDRERVRHYYDELGEQEWDRLEATVRGRASLEVHRRFLRRFISGGDRVLEIGAGPGRFTVELATLGARVGVTDLSSVQLALHEQHLLGTDAEGSVEFRQNLDICDTTQFVDGEFDAVVAFGGPLSYAFEHAAVALDGLYRITKPGGYVIGSVMSTLGTWRFFLAAVVAEASEKGEDVNDLILTTGDLRHLGGGHICQMYRSSDLAALVAQCGGALDEMSASNWASLGDDDALATLQSDPDRWRHFLDHEVAACAQPGALDGGTHLLFATHRD